MTTVETWQQVLLLYADYTAALDNKQWEKWPDFFLEQCVCKMQSHETHVCGLPMATPAFESCGLLTEKACANRMDAQDFHYRQQVGLPRILEDSGSEIRIETSYAIFHTTSDDTSDIHSVGRYLDTIARTDAGLKFASRVCILERRAIPDLLTGRCMSR